jgi:hypothetical protein
MQCNSSFTSHDSRTKYCGLECRRAAKCAYLRAYMKAYRAREGFKERKHEWRRWERERRRELTGKPPKDRLPPLTREQYLLYCKLRWNAARMPRAEALAAILGGN